MKIIIPISSLILCVSLLLLFVSSVDASLSEPAKATHFIVQNGKSMWGAKTIDIERARTLSDISILELPPGAAELKKVEMVYVVDDYSTPKLPDRRSVCLTYKLHEIEFKIIETQTQKNAIAMIAFILLSLRDIFSTI